MHQGSRDAPEGVPGCAVPASSSRPSSKAIWKDTEPTMQLRAFPVVARTTEELRPTPLSRKTISAWRVSLQLAKPTSWVLPMVALACGALASGALSLEPNRLLRLACGLFLAGPLMGGMNSVVNSLFDRDIDAINHPERPLPSGRISVNSVIAQMGLMSMAILLYAHLLQEGLGTALDGRLGIGSASARGIFLLVAATLALIYAENAPPLSLRRNTWLSGVFFGVIAVLLPWLTGNLLFAPLSIASTLYAACFGLGAIGLLILLALRKVEGDRRVGVRSLSALLGPEIGFAIGAMLVDTAYLAAVILTTGQRWGVMAALSGLLAMQIALQLSFFRRRNPPKWTYSAALVLYSAGMAIAAFTSSAHLTL